MILNKKERDALSEAAVNASNNAYAPYSHIRVGAAVMCSDGSIFHGCNVENASYGATVCAERVAVSAAIAGGHKDIKAIAVFSPDIKDIKPCGICRQFIAEFSPNITVITENYVKTISELLPDTFYL